MANNQVISQDDGWLTANIRRYWLFDKRVVVYEAANDKREAVDDWYNTVMETLKSFPEEGEQMLAIHDMRAASLTPYVRHKSQELTKANANQKGHSIIVLPNNLFGDFMKIFVNTVIARDQANVKRRIMTSMDEAIVYMERVLAQEKELRQS